MPAPSHFLLEVRAHPEAWRKKILAWYRKAKGNTTAVARLADVNLRTFQRGVLEIHGLHEQIAADYPAPRRSTRKRAAGGRR